MMKIKVNIHQPKEKFIRRPYIESEYAPLSHKDLSYPIKRHRLNAKCDNYKSGSSNYLLYILKDAANAILSFIEWDKHTEHNHTEVCGFMIGHHYYDESKDTYFTEVESIITVPTDMSTEVYLQLSTDSMFAIEQALDAYNADHNTDCKFLGWFHTHPNSLPVFMSSTDLITQTRYFSDDLGYAIVLNPHKLYWKAFRSVSCVDVKCMMVSKNVFYNEETRSTSTTHTSDDEELFSSPDEQVKDESDSLSEVSTDSSSALQQPTEQALEDNSDAMEADDRNAQITETEE